MTLPTVECFRQMDIIDQLTALYQAILNISGSEFSPDQISGLSAWYKDAGLTIEGSNVTQWNDSSGNAKHLTIGIGETPQVGLAALNGINVVNFTTLDGVSGSPLTFGGPLLAGSEATLFVVLNKSSDFPDSGAWVTDFNFANHHPNTGLVIQDGAFSTSQKNCGAQVVPVPDIWRIFSVRSQNNDYRMEVDGQNQFTTGSSAFSNGDIFCLGVGSFDVDALTDFALKGSIAEVIVYNAFLTDGQVESVLNYLRNRFAL